MQLHPLGGRTVEVKDGAPLAVGLERLTMLREKRVPLSNYSIDLLALDDLEMQAEFVKRVTARLAVGSVLISIPQFMSPGAKN